MRIYWLCLLAMMAPLAQAQTQNLCNIEVVEKTENNTTVQVKRLTGELYLSTFQVKKNFSLINFGASNCEGIWSNLKNAEPDGRFQRYYKNGNVRNTYEYSKGKKIGQWHAFYIDGTISGTVGYKGDQKHGEQWLYYPNGSVSLRRVYVDGAAQGEEVWWDTKGQVVSIVELRNNKAVRHTTYIQEKQ